MFALVSRGFLNPAQSKLNSFVWSRGSFTSAEFTSNVFFKLLIITLYTRSICSNLRLECVGPFHPISGGPPRAWERPFGFKKEAFDFFASTEGGVHSETSTKCEHTDDIYIRMPTSTLDPVSAGNMTARKRHFNFFRSSCSKGAQAFCVSLPTIVDGVSYPDAAFSRYGVRHSIY